MDRIVLDKLNYEIGDIKQQLKTLDLEMKDVLTCVETPDSSDVEGDDVDEPEADGPRNVLLQVEAIPQREADFSSLYLNQRYRENAEKKVRLMKEEVRKNFISEILLNPEFPDILDDIRETYPDDGGRNFINSLVACHIILTPDE
jgi:hypothetical protein